MLPRTFAAALCLFSLLTAPSAFAAETSASRGSALFLLNCAACHQADGRGLPGIFPPLARSDYLMADKTRSISIAIQGTSGPMVVNGVEYQGVMPAPPSLDDQQVADILTYVRSAWGNAGDAVTLAEVQAVRAALADANTDAADPFAPLPKPPAGYQLREVVRLPVHGVKLATIPGMDWILVLNNAGDLYRLEPATGNLARILADKDYAELGAGKIAVLGMTIDSQKRLYLVTNQRVSEQPWHVNRVVIFRSEPLDATGIPKKMTAWLRSSYPWGFSYYNHGVCHIAEGPMATCMSAAAPAPTPARSTAASSKRRPSTGKAARPTTPPPSGASIPTPRFRKSKSSPKVSVTLGRSPGTTAVNSSA